MPRPRKNSPNPGHLPIERVEPHLFFPNLELPGECQLLRSPLGECLPWVSAPSRQSHLLLPCLSGPDGLFCCFTLPGSIMSVGFIYCILSVCFCRSMPVHLWVRFSPRQGIPRESKYRCKDWWSPRSLRFAGLIEAPTLLLPGKCSAWAVPTPPLWMPAAGGRLQFPACSGKEERPAVSRDHSLWLPCVRTSCLVVQCDLLVLCSGVPLVRFRHAKNQISYDPTGKSWRLKPRPPSSPFGVEPRWSVPGPLREET